MLTLAALSGPLPKAGVTAVGLLAATVLLIPRARARERAAATLGALVLAPVLLLADVWHSPQLRVVHRHPLPAALGGLAVLALVVLAARGLERRPSLVAPLAVAALPFRVPISAGGTTSNLLVPLYLVVGAGALAEVFRARRGALRPPDRPPGEAEPPLGVWLHRLLAVVIVLYALQSLYSAGFEKALQQMVFFYVPFALLFCLLREVRWDAALIARCLRVVVALALVFALVGFVEFDTKTLFLNPKLIAANDVHAYFTVNSVFFDPDIFGRFLAVVMIALAGLLLVEGERREQLAVSGILALLWCGLVLTLSRSSLGALLVGLGVLAALRWRARPVLAVAAAVVALGAVAVLVTPRTFGLNQGLNNASSGRADLVTGGVSMFGQRPLWGYGSGAFVAEYRRRHPGSSQTLSASHTIPVTIAAEQGLIGELRVRRARHLRGRAPDLRRAGGPRSRSGGGGVPRPRLPHDALRRLPGRPGDLDAARSGGRARRTAGSARGEPEAQPVRGQGDLGRGGARRVLTEGIDPRLERRQVGEQEPLGARRPRHVGRLRGGTVDLRVAGGGGRKPCLVRQQRTAGGERAGLGIERRVGDPGQHLVDPQGDRRRRMPGLDAERDPHPAELHLAGRQIAHGDVLRVERQGVKGLVRHPAEQLRGCGLVAEAARPPQGRVLAVADGRQIGQAGDVVEVEVREHDVQARDAGQVFGVLDQAADPGSGVDEDRVVAVAQQRARGVASEGGEPPAAAEDGERRRHRASQPTAGRARPWSSAGGSRSGRGRR